MRLQDDIDDGEFGLNLTSMTDIVFLMLVFFMLATTYADPERALGVELPAASSSGESAPEELVVNVLEDGAFIVAGQHLDEVALRAHLQEVARGAPDTPVTIRGHRLARHESIVAVMDACGLAGLTHLSVGTTREERG